MNRKKKKNCRELLFEMRSYPGLVDYTRNLKTLDRNYLFAGIFLRKGKRTFNFLT